MKNYPLRAAVNFEYEHLSHKLIDPYRQLQNLDDPDVKKLIDEENHYCLSSFGEDSTLYKEIHKELREKIKEEDTDVPEKIDKYYYYSRSLKDKEYEIHCRKLSSLEAEEEIYFDENKWAEKFDYFDLGCLELDSSHQSAIACIDTQGDEIYSAFYLNLESGLSEKLELSNLSADVEWCNKEKVFYYLTLDESFRPYRCYRFRLETKKSELIYEESDPEYFLGLSASKDEKYIFIESHGSISSEVHYLDANDTKALPKCFSPRQQGHEYYIGHHLDKWVILSNNKQQNFTLYTATKELHQENSWIALLKSSDTRYLSDYEIFKDKLVVYARENAKDLVLFYDWQTERWEELSQPEDCHHIESADNSNFDSECFNYIYSSMTTNPRYIRYYYATKEKKLIKEYQVPKHYKQTDYESKRIFVKARDGKSIPVSILWNKNYGLENTKAAYLYAYAAYGFSMDCSFDRKILSLCDRGVLFVQVHARGGADLGRAWYEDGKFLNKTNSFYDVNDVAHYVKTQYPHLEKKLILSGGSAGGMLVGACINLEPELYSTAILNVPFVDVVNTMLDTSQALTALEYDEWGNPNIPEYFEKMLSYSPYDNIEQCNYPTILSIAAISDQRVKFWEALKYTQRLRNNVDKPENVYLFTNTSSGHSGSSGRYEFLKEVALEYNFVLQNIKE